MKTHLIILILGATYALAPACQDAPASDMTSAATASPKDSLNIAGNWHAEYTEYAERISVSLSISATGNKASPYSCIWETHNQFGHTLEHRYWDAEYNDTGGIISDMLWNQKHMHVLIYRVSETALHVQLQERITDPPWELDFTR